MREDSLGLLGLGWEVSLCFSQKSGCLNFGWDCAHENSF